MSAELADERLSGVDECYLPQDRRGTFSRARAQNRGRGDKMQKPEQSRQICCSKLLSGCIFRRCRRERMREGEGRGRRLIITGRLFACFGRSLSTRGDSRVAVRSCLVSLAKNILTHTPATPPSLLEVKEECFRGRCWRKAFARALKV